MNTAWRVDHHTVQLNCEYVTTELVFERITIRDAKVKRMLDRLGNIKRYLDIEAATNNLLNEIMKRGFILGWKTAKDPRWLLFKEGNVKCGLSDMDPAAVVLNLIDSELEAEVDTLLRDEPDDSIRMAILDLETSALEQSFALGFQSAKEPEGLVFQRIVSGMN